MVYLEAHVSINISLKKVVFLGFYCCGKYHNHKPLGKERVKSSYTFLPHSLLLRKARAGTHSRGLEQELKQRLQRKAAYLLPSNGLFKLLDSLQDCLPRV